MVSPELLRRYPFFGFLDDAQLKAIAMISEEESYDQGQIILQEGKPAEALYILIEGALTSSIQLIKYKPDFKETRSASEFPVDEVNPGEPFNFSPVGTSHIHRHFACGDILPGGQDRCTDFAISV
jgi:CRP-like cAMP-binding protein